MTERTTVEGYLFNVEPVISKKDYRFRLGLKNPNGQFNYVDDREPFEFWYSSSFPGIEEILRQEGIDFQKVSRRTVEGERELYEITVVNPQFDPSIIERKLGPYPGKIIGKERSRVISYMLRKDLRPFDYVIASGYVHDGVVVTDEIRIERNYSYPNLTMLAFDFEIENPIFPNPREARYPIIIVSIQTNGRPVYQISSVDELQNIKWFFNEVKALDPDLLVSWNGNAFDLQYIENRAKREHKISYLPIGRDGKKARKRTGGLGPIYDIPSRGNVDMFLLLYKLWDFPSRRLSDAARVILGKEPSKFDVTKIHELWKAREARALEELRKYAEEDARNTFQIAEKLGIGEVTAYLCNVTGVPIDKIYSLSSDKIADLIVQRTAYRKNWILHDRTWIPFDKLRTEKQLDTYNGRKRTAIKGEKYPDAYVLPKGHIISTKRLHIYNIIELRERFEEENRGPIVLAAEELYEEMRKYRKHLRDESYEFTLEQLKYRFLKDIGYNIPALLFDIEYTWHHNGLATDLQNKYEEKLSELIELAPYVGWDKIIIPSTLLSVPLLSVRGLDLEKRNVPVLVSDKEHILYMSHGIPITDGYRLERRERSKFLNNLLNEVAIAALTEGPNRALDIAQERVRKLRELPPEELEFKSFPKKPVYRYKRKSDVAKAAEALGTKPFEQLSFFPGGSVELDEQTRKIYINRVIEWTYPLFQAFGVPRKHYRNIITSL